MKKPNLLLLMTDQQRWDALGCSGGWVKTPNLDRIASEGIRFANGVTNSPVCIPARLSLATGLYPHNTGVWNNMRHELAPTAPTRMQAVRNAGHRTSLFGKTRLHPHSGDLRNREGLMHAYGLDDVNEIGGPRASACVLSHMTAAWEAKGLWEAYKADYDERFRNKPHAVRPSVLGLENYADVYVGRQAKKYLENYVRPEPWFCWVSFGGPHEPWDAPEPYASLYDPEAMPAAVPRLDDRPERPRGKLDERLANQNVTFEPGEVGRLRANYAGNVTLIDDQVGEILQVIEARGELDNTVIVHVSDHGEMNGDYGLLYKSNFLNGAVRAPLIGRTPEIRERRIAGSVCYSPVEWFDIGPTLVELAGGELKHQQFAKSLRPLLLNPAATHREEAISEIDGEIMLLNQEWKIALNAQGEAYLLFDAQDDSDEVNNLAGVPEMRDVENRLRLRILERLVQSQRDLRQNQGVLTNALRLPP
jgi:choline-sulfatase